jgi:hydroxylamine reductase (hybrid-cluster protein)
MVRKTIFVGKLTFISLLEHLWVAVLCRSIVTTNCIVAPRRAYKNRLFTMNEVGFDGVQHVGPDRDFSTAIEMAQELKGFPKTVEPADYHTVGFNHRAVLPLAGDVIDAVQKGVLSRIVLIGGCDGSQWDRKYVRCIISFFWDCILCWLTLKC